MPVFLLRPTRNLKYRLLTPRAVLREDASERGPRVALSGGREEQRTLREHLRHRQSHRRREGRVHRGE